MCPLQGFYGHVSVRGTTRKGAAAAVPAKTTIACALPTPANPLHLHTLLPLPHTSPRWVPAEPALITNVLMACALLYPMPYPCGTFSSSSRCYSKNFQNWSVCVCVSWLAGATLSIRFELLRGFDWKAVTPTPYTPARTTLPALGRHYIGADIAHKYPQFFVHFNSTIATWLITWRRAAWPA